MTRHAQLQQQIRETVLYKTCRVVHVGIMTRDMKQEKTHKKNSLTSCQGVSTPHLWCYADASKHACRVASNNCKWWDILSPQLAKGHSYCLGRGRDIQTFVTMDPAPTVLPLPIVRPGKIMAPPPIQQSCSIVIGRPD